MHKSFLVLTENQRLKWHRNDKSTMEIQQFGSQLRKFVREA